ncbi:hypothetical protein KSP40_PGU011920 [Platanthera guangdongensis]|uniref:Secreted protein n=1 Tax=Platanthera guangdongensis TaxID=2320717 RepID=A0ABR2LQX9_9ASPA
MIRRACLLFSISCCSIITMDLDSKSSVWRKVGEILRSGCTRLFIFSLIFWGRPIHALWRTSLAGFPWCLMWSSSAPHGV